MNTSVGPGRRPIPADLYLARWRLVVDSLRAGLTIRQIYEKHGACAETVRHVRRFMMERGWTPPKRERPKKAKPEPKPRKPRMTGADLIRKYPALVRALRKRKTIKQATDLAGVRVNTVRIVRRALVAQGVIPADRSGRK